VGGRGLLPATLAQERAAVLDEYFEGLSVDRGSGWQRIAELPPLFPDLSGA
jgi:hypothetical protein